MTAAKCHANVEGITWLPPGDVLLGRREYQMLRETSGEHSQRRAADSESVERVLSRRE